MRNKILTVMGALAAVTAAALVPRLVAQAPSSAAKTTETSAPGGSPLRTAWGEPDLQGLWDGQTLTPLERPRLYESTPVLSEKEAAEVARRVVTNRGGDDRPTGQGRDRRGPRGSEEDVAGAYNAFWQGGGTRLTKGRTSLIVDPPDGKVPHTPEAKKKAENDLAFRLAMLHGQGRTEFPEGYNVAKLNRADGPEDRADAERCYGGRVPDFGTFYQITQSPRHVAMFYDTGQGQGFNRVIPVDGSKHLPQNVRLWWGDARGRWEGNTLVVDTTNFTHKTNFHGSRENLHVIERFTRVDSNTIEYELKVEDPTVFTKPWTVQNTWTKMSSKENRVFEPTCHVGNYGLTGILSGARADEKAFKEGRGPDPFKLDRYSGGGSGPDGKGQGGGGIERAREE